MGPLRAIYLAYALQLLSILTALAGQSLSATEFLFLLPALAAVLLSYALRSRVRGTDLEPHGAWLLHTFWIAAGTLAAATLVLGPFVLLGLGLNIGRSLFISPLLLAYVATGIWTAYRIGRGVRALYNGRSPTTRTSLP
jgi:uncharacterized membrane protein